jgi:hypothetical protein
MVPRLLCLLLFSATLIPAQRGKPDPAPRLTDEDKIELLRGLTAEHATIKSFLPRSKKALAFKSDGTWDKADWREIGREYGPVGRTGDDVVVTKVDFDSDKIILQINGGLNLKGKWYEHIEAGMGGGGGTVPLSRTQSRSAGTTIAVVFPGRVPPIKPAEVKDLLNPVLDFAKRSVTENYFDSLPPEIQEAIKAKRAEVGMNRDQVLLALGHPRDRLRETNDGVETEDWIYGLPPGKITFVTFSNGKVIKVRDAYAGLGGSTAPPLKPPQ